MSLPTAFVVSLTAVLASDIYSVNIFLHFTSTKYVQFDLRFFKMILLERYTRVLSSALLHVRVEI